MTLNTIASLADFIDSTLYSSRICVRDKTSWSFGKALSLHLHHHFRLSGAWHDYFKAALLGSSTFGTREDEDLRMVWLNDRRHQGGAKRRENASMREVVGDVEVLEFWLVYTGIYRFIKGYNLDRFQLWFRWIDDFFSDGFGWQPWFASHLTVCFPIKAAWTELP